MTLAMTQVTGRFPLPDNSIPLAAIIVFVLSGVDTAGPDTVLPVAIPTQMDGAGNIDVELWSNGLGGRGTHYRVYANVVPPQLDVTIPQPESIFCGIIEVPASGPVDVADLLTFPPPDSTQANALQLAEAAAEAAALSAAAAAGSAAAAALSEGAAGTSAATASSAAGAAATAKDQVLAVQANLPKPRGPWVTARVYALGDIVSISGASYICIIAHTSATFATDLGALRWTILAEKGAAGAGTGDVLAANNLSDLADKPAARGNLGLGSMATQAASNVAITGGTALLSAGTEVTLASTGHSLQLGASSGTNMAFDTNEIQGRNNGAASGIQINPAGGSVTLGDASSTIVIPGSFSPTGNAMASQSVWDAGASTVERLISAAKLAARFEKLIKTPAFYSNDIAAMFASGPGIFSIPAGDYGFTTPFTIPAGSIVLAAVGARFVPTAAQVGAARDVALVTLGAGVLAPRLEVRIPTGVTTVSIGIEVGTNCQCGTLKVTSVSYNNNNPDNTGAYHTYAGVLIRGDDVTVDNVETDNIRTGLRFFASARPSVGRVNCLRASLGINPRDVVGLRIGSWNVETIPYANQTRTWNSNGAITGENSILFSGVHGAIIGPGTSQDSLEHAIRVGTGIERTNQNITIQAPRLIRPYGCGFKCDDGDTSLTNHIHVYDVYCEDVGRDNEVIATVPTSTWGNKECVAIRNVEYAEVHGLTTRAINYTNCGRHGAWFEKSSRGSFLGLDINNPQEGGLAVSTNGAPLLDFEATGTVSNSGADGVAISALVNGDTINRLSVRVDVYNAGAYSYRADDRPDGSAPYSGPCLIAGFARGAATGLSAFGAATQSSANFFDETRNYPIRQALYGSTTYNQGAVAAGAMGAPTTITVTGAAVGDEVSIVGPGASVGITWIGTVSAANTVTCFCINPTAASVDPASGTLRAIVRKSF